MGRVNKQMHPTFPSKASAERKAKIQKKRSKRKTNVEKEHDLIVVKRGNNGLISRLVTISTAKQIDELSNKFENMEIYEKDLKNLNVE